MGRKSHHQTKAAPIKNKDNSFDSIPSIICYKVKRLNIRETQPFKVFKNKIVGHNQKPSEEKFKTLYLDEMQFLNMSLENGIFSLSLQEPKKGESFQISLKQIFVGKDQKQGHHDIRKIFYEAKKYKNHAGVTADLIQFKFLDENEAVLGSIQTDEIGMATVNSLGWSVTDASGKHGPGIL